MAKSTSINLSDHFVDLIDGLVKSGRYGSASEVVRTGLRLLEQRQKKLEVLERALQEGLDSGEAVGFDMDEWLEGKRTRPGREEAA